MTNEEKRNIIIVECRSTGVNFIADIYNRGYNPVILDTTVPDTEMGQNYRETLLKAHENISYDFDLINEQETYEETLEMVKKYNPLLILPGNEKGVVLASRLSYDLGLKCNDIKNLDAMTLKDEMQNRLAENGLRSIRGKLVRSKEEAIDYYDSEGLTQVVLKPRYGMGSTSVRICADKDEMIKYLEEIFSKTNRYGEEINEILLQERIIGDEYIVNTVSCKGEHRVTLVWKYTKVKTSDGAMVYDTCETVNELNLGEAEMIEYAYDVADALEIQYGPVHGEYMIDEKGPVLIEVNCRPCGGHMSAKFLDIISGQHETDSILDAYLKPEHFHEKQKEKYELYNYGALKFFIVPKKMVAASTPMKNISIQLESHVETAMDDVIGKTYFKTEDVDTACGIEFLANNDYAVLQDNINYLRNVEKHAFSLVLSEEKEIEAQEDIFDMEKIKQLVNKSSKYGTGLFITDQHINGVKILQSTPYELDAVESKFDYVIINLNKILLEKDTSELVKIMLESFDKVKTGGIIIIPQSTYHQFNSGRKGMEALIKVLGMKIELPPSTIKNTIVASKR